MTTANTFSVWLAKNSTDREVALACRAAQKLVGGGHQLLLPSHLAHSTSVLKAVGGQGFMVSARAEHSMPGVITSSTYPNPRKQAMKVNRSYLSLSAGEKALLGLQVTLLSGFGEKAKVCIHNSPGLSKVAKKIGVKEINLSQAA